MALPSFMISLLIEEAKIQAVDHFNICVDFLYKHVISELYACIAFWIVPMYGPFFPI